MNKTFNYVLLFIIMVLLQVLLDYIHISKFILPQIYIFFIILLPFNRNYFLTYFWCFLLGLTIDLLSNTLGVHALCSVLVAYIRYLLLYPLAGNIAFNIFEKKETIINIKSVDFLKYSFTLTFIHNLVLFMLWDHDYRFPFFLLLKSILSTAISILLMLIFFQLAKRKNYQDVYRR